MIVLDLTLPHVDGRDFLGFLRTSPRYQSIPLIVLTGSSRMSDKQRCESLQVERYVVKPFTTAQLAALIPTFTRFLSEPMRCRCRWRGLLPPPGTSGAQPASGNDLPRADNASLKTCIISVRNRGREKRSA